MFLCRFFCGRKWPRRSKPLPHFFSSPVPSFAINWRWSISQLPLQSHSESSLGRSWTLRYRSGKWKKWKVCPEQWWKIHGIQNRLAELHGSILSCLGSTIVQDSQSFRCSCVYFATQYNVHYDNRLAGHLLSALRFAKMHGRHYFSPQPNGATNHWKAWQCTFNPLRAKTSFQLWYPGGQRLKVISFSWSGVKSHKAQLQWCVFLFYL